MNILIIDDSHDLCNSIKKYLEYRNHEVDTADNGQKGLRMALTNKYDIILLDVMMPQMNGYEVLKKLKAEQRHAPVILITAKNDVTDMIEGLELGADDFIQKPFNIDVLIARMNAIARRSKITGYEGNILRYADISLNKLTRKLSTEQLQITLTKPECELMDYMIKNSSVIVPSEKLAEVSDIGDKTDSYMENLIKRLRYLCSKVKIIFINGVGYKLCY